MSNPSLLLEAKKISKRFGGVHALEEVDFRLHPGEVVALAGDNGASNSSLAQILNKFLSIPAPRLKA